MNTTFHRLLLGTHLLLGGALLVGCNDNPTTAVIENGYPSAGDAGSPAATTVFRGWWVTTLFSTPVAPGATSEAERTIPGSDDAYVLIAPGWTPESAGPPGQLIALKSRSRLSASEHSLLTIAVSDETFAGNCAAGSTLSAADAQLVVDRLFPAEFAGVTYDPSTCTTAPAPADGAAGGKRDAGDASPATP